MRPVVDLGDVDRGQVPLVGGKGANLGELLRWGEVPVPGGFVVTTDAFRFAVAELPAFGRLVEDARSAELRELLSTATIPDTVTTAVRAALATHGERHAYAVRSSATAEDLPDASFAGQQDSFLDVVGPDAVLEAVRRCWASLYTERAMVYRRQHGFAERDVAMAVVVQRMVAADAAGVLFTADPVTGNRSVVTVEAVAGLGEALVSGQVTPDVYTERAGRITSRPVAGDGVLSDPQVARLAALGRRIETHAGRPQDVEWCRVGEDFQIVQTRAITTAFPPPPVDDGEVHVFVSVGHQQMMTDAMKPLGLALWHLTTQAVMAEAGGRLFVDVTGRLAEPGTRSALLDVLGRGDPLIRDALETFLGRTGVALDPSTGPPVPPPLPAADAGPAPEVVADLIARNEAGVADLRRDLADVSGPPLLEALARAFDEDKRVLFEPRSLEVIMAGMNATWWLNDRLALWLGEQNAADTLTLSAPHNVTSEMGLALLDVADAVRPHPEVVAYLEDVERGTETPSPQGFLDRLGRLDAAVRAAFAGFLDRYGMRCAGEIDVTRTRWAEDPALLVPTVLGNVRNVAAGESRRRVEQGERAALTAERDLLDRLSELPDGATKAAEVARMIRRLRMFTGYREYPKYGKIARLFVYKQALLREADRLVAEGVLDECEQIFFLRYDEFADLVRSRRTDDGLRDLVARRREEFRAFEALTPPRVLTSEGEALSGSYRRGDAPDGALIGIAVSAGVVEGRARVVLDMAHADLDAGDILVTAFTDPSWTPLFLTVAGLVTEVGGQMTHGAVIAREYGLPAVVGVEGATRLIRDGQRIRVHGGAGTVELLEP